MELYSFLTLMIVTLVVSLVAEVIKKWKNLTGIGVQMVVLGCAVIIALFQFGWQYVPEQIAQAIITVMTLAIGWYELVIKHFE